MRGRPPGSVVRLRVNRWDGEHPLEGDFIRTTAGSCYRIDDVKKTRDERRVLSLGCTKLEQDAVAEDQEGVWLWAWTPRTRRRRN